MEPKLPNLLTDLTKKITGRTSLFFKASVNYLLVFHPMNLTDTYDTIISVYEYLGTKHQPPWCHSTSNTYGWEIGNEMWRKTSGIAVKFSVFRNNCIYIFTETFESCLLMIDRYSKLSFWKSMDEQTWCYRKIIYVYFKKKLIYSKSTRKQ